MCQLWSCERFYGKKIEAGKKFLARRSPSIEVGEILDQGASPRGRCVGVQCRCECSCQNDCIPTFLGRNDPTTTSLPHRFTHSLGLAPAGVQSSRRDERPSLVGTEKPQQKLIRDFSGWGGKNTHTTLAAPARGGIVFRMVPI